MGELNDQIQIHLLQPDATRTGKVVWYRAIIECPISSF